MSMLIANPSPHTRRIAGIALIVGAVLSAIGMLHHPTAHAHEPATLLRAVLTVATLTAWVHGGLIAIMLANVWALCEFSALRGWHRGANRAAFGLYAIGVLAMLIAALTSGFLSTRIAAHYVDADAAQQAQAQALLVFGWAVNQTSAVFAVLMMSAAIALWSITLLGERGAPRALGLLGMLVALGGVASLALGALHLNVSGMLAITLGHAAWYVAVGAWMMRGTTSSA